LAIVASVSLLLLSTACAPVPASPPHLIATWPAAGASVKSATTLELTFNRALEPASSSVELVHMPDGQLVTTDVRLDPTRRHRLRIGLGEPLSPGDHYVRWHATDARSLASQDGTFGFTVQPGTRIAPRLDIRGDAVRNGDALDLSGQGFAAHAQVQVTIGDDDQPLQSVRADARGAFSISPRIPPGVAFGVQPVSATDDSGNRATAAIKVRWGGWPPVVAWTMGQAGPAAREVTLSVTLRNRSDYVLERVRVVMLDPEGAIFLRSDNGARHADGQVAWEFGWLDRGLAGPLHATYRTDHPIASHTAIHFRHRRPRGCEDDECLSAFVSETASDSALIEPLV
jgi:methionine-rich copper-binding protein CopC